MPLQISPRAAVSLYKHTFRPRLRASSSQLRRPPQKLANTSAATVRSLSTTKRNGASSPQTGSDKKRPFDDQVEPPKMSFSDLGASRPVKVVVIVALAIVGTMESIFWMRVLWEKFGPAPKEEQKESSVESKPT